MADKRTANDVTESEWREIQERVEAGESVNSVADSFSPGSGRAFREVVRRRCNSEEWAYPHIMGERTDELRGHRIADNVILAHDTPMDRACAVLLERQGECVVVVSRAEKKRVMLLGDNAKGVRAGDLDVIAAFPEGFLKERQDPEGDTTASTECSIGTYSAKGFEPLTDQIAKISDPILKREAVLAEAVLAELARDPEANLPKPKTGSEVRAWIDIHRRALEIEDKTVKTPLISLSISGNGPQPRIVEDKGQSKGGKLSRHEVPYGVKTATAVMF